VLLALLCRLICFLLFILHSTYHDFTLASAERFALTILTKADSSASCFTRFETYPLAAWYLVLAANRFEEARTKLSEARLAFAKGIKDEEQERWERDGERVPGAMGAGEEGGRRKKEGAGGRVRAYETFV
jgi:hypothetical protein